MGSLELDNNYVVVFNALNVFLIASTMRIPDISIISCIIVTQGMRTGAYITLPKKCKFEMVYSLGVVHSDYKGIDSF